MLIIIIIILFYTATCRTCDVGITIKIYYNILNLNIYVAKKCYSKYKLCWRGWCGSKTPHGPSGLC
jgi:hypothetical protein